MNFRSLFATLAISLPTCTGAWATALPFGMPVFKVLTFPDRQCNVMEYGASASRIFDDTRAFQAAIDDCAGKGGGTVRVPRGYYFVSALFLKSNINFRVEKFAEVAFRGDIGSYKATNATKTYTANQDFIALINIADADNVAITGQGRLDGQGQIWWDRFRAETREHLGDSLTNRPRFIHAQRSTNLLFEGVSLVNAPSFHVVIKHSDSVVLRGLRVISPAHSLNTDGIDPSDSRNVLIEDNFIDTGDDHIAIKATAVNPKHPDAATENIVVRNNQGLSGRGICIGSESIGGIRNVLVENNTINGAVYGIRIKSPRGRGGLVQNISFRNNTFTDVEVPITVSAYYDRKGYDEKQIAARLKKEGGFVLGAQIYPADTDPAQAYTPNRTPDFRNITFDGITATGALWAGMVLGLPEAPVQGLLLKNINIIADQPLLVRHAIVTLEAVKIATDSGKPLANERGATISWVKN